MQKEEPIVIMPYDPNWKDKFYAEKELIAETIGQRHNIVHVGSTSVPGLDAKPIIDIMIGVDNFEYSRTLIPLLQLIGYKYFPYKPDTMHWFCKPSVHHRDFHLYLIATTHSEWKSRLAFRDYLATHSDVAQEYLNLKTDLAKRFRDDREAYTQGKSEFIKSVLKKIFSE